MSVPPSRAQSEVGLRFSHRRGSVSGLLRESVWRGHGPSPTDHQLLQLADFYPPHRRISLSLGALVLFEVKIDHREGSRLPLFARCGGCQALFDWVARIGHTSRGQKKGKTAAFSDSRPCFPSTTASSTVRISISTSRTLPPKISKSTSLTRFFILLPSFYHPLSWVSPPFQGENYFGRIETTVILRKLGSRGWRTIPSKNGTRKVSAAKTRQFALSASKLTRFQKKRCCYTPLAMMFLFSSLVTV